MKFFRLITILQLLLLATFQIDGQFLKNKSFEGEPGIGNIPEHWIAGSSMSTPDTEPIDCDNSLFASDGSTYLTLVTRGPNNMLTPNFEEFCYTQLSNPLKKGLCYNISFDIASRPDVGFFTWKDGFTTFDNPTELIISASQSISDNQDVLYESGQVLSVGWKKISLIYIPENNVNFIWLKAKFYENSGNGNVSIDNFSISESIITSKIILDTTLLYEDLPIKISASESTQYNWVPNIGLSCFDCQSPEISITDDIIYTVDILDDLGCPAKEIFIIHISDSIDNVPHPQDSILFVPNVFTPNNDGINDFFEIPGLPSFSSILIFNSLGHLVYQKENYINDWNGTDLKGENLPEGNFWYVLVQPGFKAKKKGLIYLKR